MADPARVPPETGSRAGVARNAGSMTLGKILGDFLTFLFFVALSRIYGQEGLGEYSFAMALTGFLMVTSNFGLYYLSIRDLSRCGGAYAEEFGRILSLRLILVAASLAPLGLLTAVLPFPVETRLVILFIGLYQIGYTLLNGCSALFVARERMHVAAWIEVSLRAVTTGIGISVAATGGSLVQAVAALPVATYLLIAICLLRIRALHGGLRLSFDAAALRATLARARPFALSQFLFLLTSRIDVLFLGLLLGWAAAGVYNAAYRVVFLLTYLAQLIGVAILPLASRLWIDSRDELKLLYRQAGNLALLVSMPAAAGVYLIAPELVLRVYSEEFSGSIKLLRLLCALLLLAGLKSVLEMFLMACDRQVQRTRAQWHAAWINVVGNAVLIPTVGVTGAAVATIVSETTLVALLLFQLHGVLGRPWAGSRVAIGIAATACFMTLFGWLGPPSLVVTVPGSILLYAAVLLAFRSIREREGRLMLGVLLGRRGASPAGSGGVSE